MQKARELRMPLREGTARREWTYPDAGPGLFREAHHLIDRLGAIDAVADDKGGMLARPERLHQRLPRLAIGADLATDLAGRQGLRRTGPAVGRNRHEGRPVR